jgi:hypothetical protein
MFRWCGEPAMSYLYGVINNDDFTKLKELIFLAMLFPPRAWSVFRCWRALVQNSPLWMRMGTWYTKWNRFPSLTMWNQITEPTM